MTSNNLPAHALGERRAPNTSTMPRSLDQINAGNRPASSIGAALDLVSSFEREPAE